MYYLPTRIIFGEHALPSSQAQIAGLGSKALIVTGKSSAARSGALDELLNFLAVQNPVIYDGINENPHLESVVTGAELMREQDCDYVIGIGGGSPLDAANAISLAAANKLGIDDIYRTDLFRRAFPIALSLPLQEPDRR
jgi:alcohol dehydrogenase